MGTKRQEVIVTAVFGGVLKVIMEDIQTHLIEAPPLALPLFLTLQHLLRLLMPVFPDLLSDIKVCLSFLSTLLSSLLSCCLYYPVSLLSIISCLSNVSNIYYLDFSLVLLIACI
jgi:hypothetical protein